MRRSWLLFLFLSSCFFPTVQAQKKDGWTPLFNGKDLSNWDTYLRAPNLVGYSDDSTIPYQPPIGLNNDPLHVFTVQNGILRISGQIWGAITTKKEYSNYHVRFITKWGTQKWKSKDTYPRDGGLLFHCTEGFDYAFKCWMRSLEMQLQEGEIGDLFNVGAGDVEAQYSLNEKTLYNEKSQQYDPSAPLQRYPGRIYRSANYESPAGEWTVSEMVARQADAVFIVNGFVVNRIFNIFRKDLNQQVTTGKLQFQSEGAEHFYKSIDIRPILFQHRNPVLQASQKEYILSQDVPVKIDISNSGEEVEIIAAELIGKNIEQLSVKLPPMPLVIKKGEKMTLMATSKSGAHSGDSAMLRLETVLGPVADFHVNMMVK